ncbi:MAG: M23 family metallopeptidase [Microbacterium sp.]|uniref:M23 family metallopeptidase n=1 Tax=Microbacterium sp. TaxID=51671 RepID=UPI001ACD48C9|nr:M23 family metallopeptidase [Microbacterium sp.]MBN9176442.1 M23 family metallopeptidase [Microbacterium sp.]
MGAPVAVAAALANTRTGRKIAIGAVVILVVVTFAVLTPLLAIPMMIAGQSASAAVEQHGTAALPAASGEWGYPLAGPYSVGRGYGYNPVEGCSYCNSDHRGFDMDQPCGATIFAAGLGTVVQSGPLAGGWGNAITIDHGGGLQTRYAHLQWGSQLVQAGDAVHAGTPIGAEGSTGDSTGCHLHYEVIQDGVRVDPEPYMAALGLPLR